MDPAIKEIVVNTAGPFSSRLVQTAAIKAGYRWGMRPKAELKHVKMPALVFNIKARYITYSSIPEQAATRPHRDTLTIGQAIKFFETGRLASSKDIDCTIPEEEEDSC